MSILLSICNSDFIAHKLAHGFRVVRFRLPSQGLDGVGDFFYVA